MESGLTKNKILSELSKSPHGKLSEYLTVGQQAVKSEPEFFAHLISWDRTKGQIRDAKVALPVVSLSVPFDTELAENSLAHIGMLGPRELLRAYHFAQEIKIPGNMRKLRRLIEAYLRQTESNYGKWQRIALQHRGTLKSLYGLLHIKPNTKADEVIMKGGHPAGSIFETVAQLKNMSASEAAGAILERKIPFLIAMGALGSKAKQPDLVLALIKNMSANELVTNTKFLERLGVKTNPVLRGAFAEGLKKVSKSNTNILKTTRAAEEITDEGLKETMRGVQERQIQNFGGVDGNWLVLADKSGSMAVAIDTARQVAATLAKMVKGKVWLTFFDTTPQTIEVTGAPLDAIQKATRYIQANGGTSIGCGLQRLLDEKIEIDGIAIVSDGAEHSPPYFTQVYKNYSEFAGREVPVYMYDCDGEPSSLIRQMRSEGIDMQVFNLRGSSVDYYSLPNLVRTMRTNRYSLVDEVMATKLLTLKDVFKTTEEVRKNVFATA